MSNSLYCLCKELHKPGTCQLESVVTIRIIRTYILVSLDCGLLLYPMEGLAPPMGMTAQDRVEEHKAAVLLGLTTTELRRFSRLSGIGHLEESVRGQEVVFTYEELRRLCLLAAQSSK